MTIAAAGGFREDRLVTSQLGVMIRAARKAQRLTQAELGRLIDETCDGNQVSKWERGSHKPTRRRFMRLLDVLEHLDAKKATELWFADVQDALDAAEDAATSASEQLPDSGSPPSPSTPQSARGAGRPGRSKKAAG